MAGTSFSFDVFQETTYVFTIKVTALTAKAAAKAAWKKAVAQNAHVTHMNLPT